MRVVCIQRNWHYKDGSTSENPPIVGEIYTIMFVVYTHDGHYYKLKEKDGYWNEHGFRPTDSSYGEAICETIEQQIELEKVIEV